VSILIISMSSSTWQCQIWNLTMFMVVSSYIHVSQSLHMLHLVLFLAYSERNLAKHFRPPKLVEFVSLKQIMHRNIFIPLCLPRSWWSILSLTTTNTPPKLKSLLVLEQSLNLGSVDQELLQCQTSYKYQVYNPILSL